MISKNILNKFSRVITEDLSQGASQAMLYALGMTKDNIKFPHVGIGSVQFDGNPCNNHLGKYADKVKYSIEEHVMPMHGLRFNTVGVSDGISMGTKGMNYSLPSRELISDSLESMVMGHSYDGCVAIAGCDKNLPGCLMGLIKVNRPSLMIYGGSTLPGIFKESNVDIVDAFQSYGKMIDGEITKEEQNDLISCCIPQSGSCGGMYTANTMAVAIEAMGMCLPYSSSNPALTKYKFDECNSVGKTMFNLLYQDIKPSDIITKESIYNSIKAVIACGGSTNAVLHLLAISNIMELGVYIEDFNEIGKDIPVLGNFKPHGKYLMYDLHKIGGTPLILKYLLEEDFLNGDTLTVTGKTLAQNLEKVDTWELRNLFKHQDIFKIKEPIKKDSHIRIFKGNLAKHGAVGKITGKEGTYFEGKALVFEDETSFIKYLENEKNKTYNSNNSIFNKKRKTVVVIRNQGPKGGPGMPEMLKPTSAIVGLGLQNNVAFITDGRFSGGSHGFIIGHISPEAQSKGVISVVKNNDVITIDAVENIIQLEVSEVKIKNRLDKLTSRKKYNKKNFLSKYIKTVTPASVGAFTY